MIKSKQTQKAKFQKISVEYNQKTSRRFVKKPVYKTAKSQIVILVSELKTLFFVRPELVNIITNN